MRTGRDQKGRTQVDRNQMPQIDREGIARLAAKAEAAARAAGETGGEQLRKPHFAMPSGAVQGDGWREFGRPEGRNCPYCGELIPVEIEEFAESRLRIFTPSAHDCGPKHQALAREREAARDAALHRLANPAPETVEQIRRACLLPYRSFPGLNRLTRTDVNAPALDAATALVDRFRHNQRDRGLYLHGPIGTGKTAILGALAFDLAHWTGGVRHQKFGLLVEGGSKARVQYWSLPDFFAQMRRSYERRSRYDPDEIEGLDVILWDDAGKHYSTEHNFGELFRLVDLFYTHGRAMCFSSNYNPEEFGDRLVASLGGDYARDVAAVVDRIIEVCEVIELPGKSWRQAAARS